MNSGVEQQSFTASPLALSLLYARESAALISKIRRMLTIAVVASVLLLITPIFVLVGLTEALEELILFEGELMLGLLVLVTVVPLVVYFALRSTMTIDEWRTRLDGLSFALRFESQQPKGDSAASKLANQSINALGSGAEESELSGDSFANRKLGEETYDVVVPDEITKKLGGFTGALIAKRFEGKPVSPEELKEVVGTVSSSHKKICRLLIVSDRQFSDETTELHRSMSHRGFPVDLVEETPLGFSVISSRN